MVDFENNKKGFYLLPFEQNLIRNVVLTKDVGLIPYFMHKKNTNKNFCRYFLCISDICVILV